jgi:hypothetical protein
MNIEQFSEENYNHVFDNLQDYILNKENIQKINFTKREKQQKKMVLPMQIKEKSTFFFPKEADTLFWCFYIMKYGLLNYQMINNRNIVFEKTKKIEYIEKLRKDKQSIKKYKFASLSNIESNLVNDMKINVSTFLTLCVIENINVFFIKKKMYYELELNDTNDIYILKTIDNEKYGFELILKSLDAYKNYIKQFYKIENMEKPIKAITYYKVSDLVDICIRFGIEIENKKENAPPKQKSKKELYESIILQL